MSQLTNKTQFICRFVASWDGQDWFYFDFLERSGGVVFKSNLPNEILSLTPVKRKINQSIRAITRAEDYDQIVLQLCMLLCTKEETKSHRFTATQLYDGKWRSNLRNWANKEALGEILITKFY
jgi:hypothetical protein